MANRYSQYVSGVNYAPESFRDMAVVPIAMRQRHDAALAAQDDMLLQLNNIDVRDEDQKYLNQKRQEITSRVEDLTNKINTIGAGDSNLLGEFRNTKRDYNKEVSLAGGLGQASAVKKQMELARANYLDYGTKQGWTPKTAQENFERDYNEWKGKNDSSNLGTEGFAFGEFNPTFAPKQIEATAMLKDVQPLIGEISKEEAFQNYRLVQDPNNGMYTYQNFGGSQLSKDNIKNLNYIEEFINKKLVDPQSPEMQSLRYAKGINPNDTSRDNEIRSEFLSQADSLLGAMRVKAERETTDMQAPQLVKTDSDGTKGPKVSEGASLVSTPTGAEVFEGKSMTDILNGVEYNKLENIENNRVLTDEESAKKQLLILQQGRVQEAIKDPNNIREINNNLKKIGGLQDKNGNPSTLEGYNNTISSLQNKLSDIQNTPAYKEAARIVQSHLNDGTSGATGGNMGGRALASALQSNPAATEAWDRASLIKQKLDPIKKDLDEALKQSIPLDDLQFSRMYTFGAGEEAKKAMDIFNANANDYGDKFVTLIENSGGKFTLPGDTELKDPRDEDIKLLKENLANGQAKFKLGSIIDKGATGSSQLVLNYSVGEGEKAKSGMIAIDYDNKSTDTSVIDDWMIEMQKLLDKPGQATIQAILDNKQLKGLSVDSKDFTVKGFDGPQSNSIKKYGNAVNSAYKHAPEYKKADYLSYPDRELNMVLDKDGYYTLWMKDGKNDAEPLNTGSWMNKQIAKDYQAKRYKNSNPLASKEKSDRLTFINQVYDMALLSDKELIKIDDNSSQYKKLKSEYLNAINEYKDDYNMQYQLTTEFYKTISNKKISHRNKKSNL